MKSSDMERTSFFAECAVLYPRMGFPVTFLVILLSAAKTIKMPSQVCLSQKNAGAKGTLQALLDFLFFNHDF
jgi:hypothetical protein